MSEAAALNFETIKQAVLVRLPGADPAIVDFEARWALQEFLFRSNLYRRTLNIALVEAQTDYPIPIQGYESVTVLRRASLGEARLTNGLPDPDTQTGRPAYAGLLTDRELRVWPIPSAEVAALPLTIEVCLTLLPSVEMVMPDVVRPFHHSLLDGTLARLYAMPDKPWTSGSGAAIHASRFETTMHEVRRVMDGNRTSGSVQAKIPRFGR